LFNLWYADGVQAKSPGLFGDSAIVEAVQEGSVEKTNAALLDGASVHERAIDGTPIIVLAVSARNLDLVKLLIENGARPDDKSKTDETTALTLAAANGDLAIVMFLLDHKADIDEPGALRETAIIKAVRAQRNDVAKLLVERGADLDETDSTGATALDIAQSNGSSDLVNALKKAKPK
jgi:ankyrin repeat protein